ncbi:hypothetical protein [Sphingosinicella sp. BN140058]|uniref:hypothetical protein n=1 Tax=Sphingosinicella sp. BN140058 TaxID=1892855 RepID=UPI001012F38E|nr:hypothetical protein [Sphingosinicella sp. BN140058]QAY76158.1 hypothetical protein ETR14_06160 [Sphingosinicella sp. BN140058]
MALVLLVAVPAPALSLPPAIQVSEITAEQAIEKQRRLLVEGSGIDCARGGGEEIVVCGRRGPDRDREALAGQSVAGARVGLLPGEPASGLAAMGAGDRTCAESRRCGAYVDFFNVGKVLYKLGEHLLGRDD